MLHFGGCRQPEHSGGVCGCAEQVSRNLTTNELANWARYRYMKDASGDFHNPFDQGCRRDVDSASSCWEVHYCYGDSCTRQCHPYCSACLALRLSSITAVRGQRPICETSMSCQADL